MFNILVFYTGMIKELLPIDNLTAILCYPWLELKYELNALFIEHRHTTRSAIRVCSIIISICVGLFIFFNNPHVLEFFKGIIDALSFIPEPLQYKASVSLAVLASGSFGAYTSRAIIRCVCKCKFGDPDFFLTDTRVLELIEIFKAQELDIDAELLKEVVQFCVHKLREPHSSSTIGARKQDWEDILNSIIYEADLDIFLEQQRALHYSHKIILDKKAAINAYKQLVQREAHASLSQAPPENQQATIRLTAKQLEAQEPNETTPLLTDRFNNANPARQSLSSGSSGTPRDAALAKRALNQFRQTRLGKITFGSVQSEEQVADQCSQHLETRALSTHQHLLYSHGVHNMIRRNIIPTTPNSVTPGYPTFPSDDLIDLPASPLTTTTTRHRSLSGASDNRPRSVSGTSDRPRAVSGASDSPFTPSHGKHKLTVSTRPNV